jgi:menaquinone-dependent protoporphyrinogen IX oxidase
MSLIKNNAKIAAKIAVALALHSYDVDGEKLHVVKRDEAAPIVIGGSILDVHYRVLDDNLEVSRCRLKTELMSSGA